MKLKEIIQPTKKHFDTYSTENKCGLKLCRLLCRKKGYELDNRHDDEFFKNNGSYLLNVPISKLQIGQDNIDSKIANQKDANDYKPVHIFLYNKKLYLHDGHHRTVNRLNCGYNTVKAYIVNVDKLT